MLKGKAVVVDGELEIAARRQDPPGLPRPHRGLAAARSTDQHRQAGVRLRRLLVLRGASATGWWPTCSRPIPSSNSWPTSSCYKITGGYENCIAAHEPLSYTEKYPITKNSWVALNGGRMAEIALAPGRKVAQALRRGARDETRAARVLPSAARCGMWVPCVPFAPRFLLLLLLTWRPSALRAHDPSAYGGRVSFAQSWRHLAQRRCWAVPQCGPDRGHQSEEPGHLLVGTDLGSSPRATAAELDARSPRSHFRRRVRPHISQRRRRRDLRRAEAACSGFRRVAGQRADRARQPPCRPEPSARCIGRSRLPARPQSPVHQR